MEELYPVALDAGIPIEQFWNLSLNEIVDLLESHSRTEERKRKQKIRDDFIFAEAIAIDIVSYLFTEKGSEVILDHPWDHYPELFREERKCYEEQKRKRDFEVYSERRKDYIREFNRRRQQGI